MTEEIYNTKDIRHINEKSQEYIAEGNRMAEEIIMFNKSDVESLEEAIKRLEFENRANEKQIELDVEHICRLNEQIEKLEQENKKLKKERDILLAQLVINDGEDVTVQISQSQFEQYNKYRSALEEIRDAWQGGVYNNGVNGNYRPIKNTTKEDCYNALGKIQNILYKVL